MDGKASAVTGGLGVSPDYVFAYIWFDLAAVSGDEGAPNRIGSAMTDDNSGEAAAAFIAASLRSLIRMTEAEDCYAFSLINAAENI